VKALSDHPAQDRGRAAPWAVGAAGVLNIGKLVRDQADYYLDAVARSQEEYYTGAGEAPGYWLGRAAADLGLVGTVTQQGLRHLLAGRIRRRVRSWWRRVECGLPGMT
jgi:TrwC relaxase